MGMNPGKLREYATLQENVAASDGQGGLYPADWQDFATNPNEWVRVNPLSSRTRALAMQADAPVTHEITMRHRTDVKAKHRVLLDDGRAFQLVGSPMNEDERFEYVVFAAQEDPD